MIKNYREIEKINKRKKKRKKERKKNYLNRNVYDH